MLILKGEKYDLSTHVYSGDIYDWKAHKDCTRLVTNMDMQSLCDEGVTQDDFMEIISDTYPASFDDRRKNKHTWKDMLQYAKDKYLTPTKKGE